MWHAGSELKRRNGNQRHANIRLCVRREYVFEESFHQIVLRKPEELKGKLSVVFQGEEGVDAGGLTRSLSATPSAVHPPAIQSFRVLLFLPWC